MKLKKKVVFLLVLVLAVMQSTSVFAADKTETATINEERVKAYAKVTSSGGYAETIAEERSTGVTVNATCYVYNANTHQTTSIVKGSGGSRACFVEFSSLGSGCSAVQVVSVHTVTSGNQHWTANIDVRR